MQKANNVGIGVAVAIAVGLAGSRKPTAIAIATAIATPMLIPIPTIASQREHGLLIRRRVRNGAWATVPNLATDFRPARTFAGAARHKF